VPVLAALHRGALRRAVLRDELRGVSDKILTDTLRRMETNGLVIRSIVPSVPIEVDYALTEYGRSLRPVLSVVHNWAANSPNPPALNA
jgi:DNA-binding HxlR family transcriptional regulator